jgi:hypothetical protein
VATAAEEAKNPVRDMPIGIVGSLLASTVLYMLMCATICGMQPYGQIDLDAPFAAAFERVGMGWARRLVAAGALAGIVTSLLVSLMGQARIYVTLGRARLLPPWFARVRQASGTPVNAQLVTASTAGVLALLFDIEVLAELVSIGGPPGRCTQRCTAALVPAPVPVPAQAPSAPPGPQSAAAAAGRRTRPAPQPLARVARARAAGTLFVFFVVCSGVLFRRYHVPGPGQGSPAPVLWRLLAVAAASVGFSVSYTERAPAAVPASFLALWLGATMAFYTLPVTLPGNPLVFRVPLSPLLPCAGILATLHLIGSLGWPAYVRWVVWWAAGSCVYLGYGLHRTQQEGSHLSPQPSGVPPAGAERRGGGAPGAGPGAALLGDVEMMSGGAVGPRSWSPGRPQRKKGSGERLSLLGEALIRSDAGGGSPQRPASALL